MKLRTDYRSSTIWRDAHLEKWFVYTAYDARGVALYVGCTARVQNRIRSHRAKEWRSRATHFGVVGPFPRETAHDLESVLIAARDPLGNVSGTVRDPRRRKPWTPPVMVADLIAERSPADIHPLVAAS